MSLISVNNLTFCYEGSFDNIFENVSFAIDTNWKLGFIGRNGKGKTTFLSLLSDKYEYNGSITKSVTVDYFPYKITDKMMSSTASDFFNILKPNCEEWRVICELNKLEVSSEILYRPFNTLSFGERTKILLAVLFSGENQFLLIDEPTNHLDNNARQAVQKYLASKKGFILVSHDRNLLDACIDHVLVINRKSIEIQSGNFSSWWDNKSKKDHFALAENEKHKREIATLKRTAERSKRWAEKNENTKIGFNPVKDHDRNISTRAYIGAKTKKMQSRVTQYERRIEKEISEKEGLLNDIETPLELKISPLKFHKDILVYAHNYCVGYNEKNILSNFNFTLKQGERVFLYGENGCGKSTFIKAVLNKSGFVGENASLQQSGTLEVGSGLSISYINQDTSFLLGSINNFCKERNLDLSLFCAILRYLDMDRTQFLKPMETFSEGQKKKVLISASLMTPAHIYVWDEPLNYIDVFTRMQIEELILLYKPTMLVVEHDKFFEEKVSTRVVKM